MKTAILYRSIWSTTKQYAKWLHEEIDSSMFKYNRVDRHSLLYYDLVILCTATYGGWISLKSFLQRNWDTLKGKQVVLLVVGSVPMEHKSSIKSYNKLPDEIRENIKYFKIIGKKFGYKNAKKIKKENLAPVIEHVASLGK